MVSRAIDHVTAVVADLDACASAIATVLGAGPASEVELPGMRILTFRAGDVELHVNAPTGPGPVRDHLERHGPGHHHVAVRCDDLDRTIAELAARGLPSLGAPVSPAPGLREVFLDPRVTGGLLVQLVERRAADVVATLDDDAVGALAGSIPISSAQGR